MAKPKVISKEEYLQLARVWVFDKYGTVTNGAIKLGISRTSLSTALKGKSPMPGTIRNDLNYVPTETYIERVK